MDVAVVGGGIFAVEAARALAERGHAVTLIAPGAAPHPLAETTDISKVVRADYGADAVLGDTMLEGLARWERWNAEAPRPLYHRTGVMFLAAAPFAPGGFEADSHAFLAARGRSVERLGGAALAERFLAWDGVGFPDGYLNPDGGWAESGEVLAWRRQGALAAGVRWLDTEARAVRDPAVVETADGEVRADRVVVAAGAWTPALVPETRGLLTTTAQPVFHLRPPNPALYVAERFPVFGADIGGTGWYGFPLHPTGVVKVANHGAGWALDPADRAREVPEAWHGRLRAFLRRALPGLAEAPVVATRACVYGDSPDGDFWIDAVPGRPGVVVAAGGSGHAFKFAPFLGEWIAAVTEGGPAPLGGRFAWRPARRAAEAARASG